MKFKSMLVVLFSLSLLAGACKKQEEAKAEEAPAQEAPAEKTDEAKPQEEAKPAEEAKKADEKAEGEKLAMVEVPKEGKEFDPEITPAQVPAGAWYCNMGGKVHYAAMDKKDGKCPVCHMNLSQKAEGEEAAAGHDMKGMKMGEKKAE